MRTDYKIGIAMVLFVAGVIVVYNVFSPNAQLQDIRAQQTPVESASTSPTPAEGSFYSRQDERDESVIPGLGDGFVARRANDGNGGNEPEESAGRQDSAARGDAPAGDAGAPQDRGGDRKIDAVAADDSGAAQDTAVRGDSNESPGAAEASWPSGQRIYVVRAGDSGFWTVAQNVYGHGKYWHLVARANPTADSNALRAGQKLKIPPLPRPGRSRRKVSLAGRIVTEGSGVKYYYVQPGDRGFWGVSERAYADGKYWAVIARANPKANSSKLRVGQKLILPPLPSAASTPHTAAGAGAARSAPGPRVSDGDVPTFD